MKHGLAAAVILCVLCASVTAALAEPQRIMSLKLCTDELLMDLAPPSRIASVTFLSREKSALRLWPQAAKLRVNHNTAEEVLAQKPDLILTDTFTSPSMLALIAHSGARVVEVPPAEDFAGIRRATRQVAAAVGEEARGEALIARMDAQLGALATGRPKRVIRVAGWGGGGYVPGRGSLFDAILRAAGGRNIVAAADGYYDVESLLAARPDILAFGDDYNDTPSLRADQNDHPVLMKFFAHRRIIYPSALYGCGAPESAAAAIRLRASLVVAMRRPGGVP
ncbi:MAG TPA: ABC transporter substrate-binding protein [Rhizomicrobium sp.]|jgi:iron complex transport system substrate-binding protein|nr:ABC transporter substrate-binding protein [Rhizomicrobium sp.]